MISDMRKHFQSPLYKATVWVGIVALAGVFSIPTLIKEVNSEPWSIKVNSSEVSAKEFSWALAEKREWLAMVRAQYGEQADFLLQAFGIKPDPMSLAMESIIKENLINDLAHQVDLRLHEQSVQDRLLDVSFIKYYLSSIVPSFVLQKDGSINAVLLRNYLLHKGMKPVEFEAAVKKAAERKCIMDIFSLGAYVPLFDKNALYSLNKAKRSFEILTFSYEKQLKEEKSKPLSDEEIAAYYATKKGSGQYTIPEKRAGVAFKFAASDYGIAITQSEIEAYYEKHKAQLYAISPKKIEVRHIFIKADNPTAEYKAQAQYDIVMENPELFAEQAKQFSEDEETALRGGLMDPFARGEKEVAFEKAAFLLKKDGDISPIIKTAEGFEIIQRVKVVQPVYQPLSQVYDSIKVTLLQLKFSSQFATDCKNMKLKFKKDKNGLDFFIQEKNGSEIALPLAPLEDTVLSKTLFSIKSIGDFDICIDKDRAFIVQLSSLEKAYQADLSEVKDAVKEDIYSNKAKKSLKNIAKEVLSASGAVSSLDGLKKNYGGSLTSIRQVSAEDLSQNDLLKDLRLYESTFAHLENVGLARFVVNDKGAHIIKVVDRIDDTTSPDMASQEFKALGEQRKRLMSEAFVASLYRNATIKTNESMIKLQQNHPL